MQTLLWYRFQTIWKQMKVVLICMGVLAGAVLLFALIGGAAAWEAGSFFFGFAVAFLSIYASMLPIFVLQVEEQEKNTDLLLTLPLTRKQNCSGLLCFNLGLCSNHGRLCIAVDDCLAGHMGNCCSCNGHCSVGEYDLSALVCVFWQPESIDFCAAANDFGRNWLFFYFRPDEWFPF